MIFYEDFNVQFLITLLNKTELEVGHDSILVEVVGGFLLYTLN